MRFVRACKAADSRLRSAALTGARRRRMMYMIEALVKAIEELMFGRRFDNTPNDEDIRERCRS
jgi:hypothetical protein